ncbi:MAG: matrixin family metalloprotease [Candidatus Acidiferrales bacterium]
MKHSISIIAIALLIAAILPGGSALGYVPDTTAPLGGGCPQLDRWSLSLASPLNRRWSTSLSAVHTTVLTVNVSGTPAQLNEIEQVITASFGAWAGVAGTTFNSSAHPGFFGSLLRASDPNSCSNDAGSNVDGLNTICFNQASTGFANGVLAFTRTITANAPGVSVGTSGPAAFAGQILDADTLFANDGQATFATPGALATAQGAGAYDLESLLTHELGHWFGLSHSPVWRAIMFPFAPPPGNFLGDRPTAQVADGPLADDDRTGIRVLYADPTDTVHTGTIQGRILPANPFSLATLPSPSTGRSVTGIFGAHVVAVDADTGAVIAGTLGGWSCDPANPPARFDGTYEIDRLAVAHNYKIYAEPLIGLVAPADFGTPLLELCGSGATTECTTPAVNLNFSVRTRPAGP